MLMRCREVFLFATILFNIIKNMLKYSYIGGNLWGI